MTSNINPNNINGAYPVAGQDNNSQGFRDNFTNTSTNFQYAANEISDLQSKVVVTSQLTGGSGLETQNNLNGQPLIGAKIRNFTGTKVALTAAVDYSITVDISAGPYQTVTLNGANSLNFTNWPTASAGLASVVLEVTVPANSTNTLQFPAAATVNIVGIQGFIDSTHIMSFPYVNAITVYTFEFSSYDGTGSTIAVNEVNKALQPFNNSSEDLAASAAASQATAISYFSTAAAETATLAAGKAGQVKVFAMYADGGDMVITVSNAGWKSSGTGTISFDAIGDACTLQYINSKWFCIGNNGCVFA